MRRDSGAMRPDAGPQREWCRNVPHWSESTWIGADVLSIDGVARPNRSAIAVAERIVGSVNDARFALIERVPLKYDRTVVQDASRHI